jgi:hypothetical protein
MRSQFDTLTQINLDDLVSAFGCQNRRVPAGMLRRLFSRPGQTFARQISEFDSNLGAYGLVDASRLTLQHYVRDLRVFGMDRIPASGFLALSNHPGMADTLSLITALNRPDLHIIALGRPFLEAMPNLSKRLVYLRDESASRIACIRQVSRHLSNGGAALTFPAGRIEPDPEVHEGAVESLHAWTDSVSVFVRAAPETAILPILVRGVVWKNTACHWLTKIRQTKEERDRLAAALQLLACVILNVRPVSVRVQIGKPIYARDLGSSATQVIHQAVLAEMKSLFEHPSEEDEGIRSTVC